MPNPDVLPKLQASQPSYYFFPSSINSQCPHCDVFTSHYHSEWHFGSAKKCPLLAEKVMPAPSSSESTTASVSTDMPLPSPSNPLPPPLSPPLPFWQHLQSKILSWWAFRQWRVKLLVHALSAMDSPVHLLAIPCDSLAIHQAGYSPPHHTIWICANRLWNPFTFRKALIHELIHAFDFARANIETQNCDHVACTEIRAYNLSQQCALLPTLSTPIEAFYASKHLPFTSKRDRCIAHRTLLSLWDHPHCNTNHKAETAVTNVFSRCIRDYWPFVGPPEQDSAWRPSRILQEQSFLK